MENHWFWRLTWGLGSWGKLPSLSELLLYLSGESSPLPLGLLGQPSLVTLSYVPAYGGPQQHQPPCICLSRMTLQECLFCASLL